jgi:hypothetical protein
MDQESQEERDHALPDKAAELFSLLTKKQNITVRDDQYDFPLLLDAVRQFRDRRYRFRLIDTGRFDAFELEWITNNGADLYTSDETRPKAHDLELISAAARKGNAVVACLVNGKLDVEEKSGLSFPNLINVGRSGVYLHLTNRHHVRDIQQISRLAYNCKKRECWLVYYHHGPLEASLQELGRSGAWIHITQRSLEEEKSQPLITDIVRSAQSGGSNLVLHWDNGNKYALLGDIIQAGAVVLFESPLYDYKSPLKDLEKGIRRKRLDYRAYYLHPSVLP